MPTVEIFAMTKLLNEFKRRNIFRAAASYAVLAWVLAQAAGLVLPAFDAPDWVLRASFTILALGFPVIVAAAWLYEITPRGLRRTRPESGTEKDSSPRIIDSVTIMALVIAVILVGIGRDGWLIGLEIFTAKDVTTLLDSNAPDSRIAVFPFSSVQSDLDSKLIAEGFAVALADRVQTAENISTVGMNSTLSLKQHPDAVRSAADALDVDRIVEGSLRRNGEIWTITVQLIAVEGREALLTRTEEVTTEQFGETLDGFAADIASKLGTRTPRREIVGFDGDQWADWLRVLGSLLRGDHEDLSRAQEIAAKLAEQAPNSGVARAAQGYSMLKLAARTASEFEAPAREGRDLLDQAISLAPASRHVLRWRAEASSLLGRWRARQADYERLLDELDHALDLFPNDPALLAIRTWHCAAFGDYARAVNFGRKALAVNPLDYRLNEVVVESLLAMARVEEAQQLVEQLSKSGSPPERTAVLEARITLAKGQAAQAIQKFETAGQPGSDNMLFALRLLASADRGEDADALLDRAESVMGEDMVAAWKASLAGDYEAAHGHALKAFDDDSPGQALMLGQIAAQAGAFEEAAASFDPHFSDWVDDSGPLLGATAWTYAPWYALALRETGRAQDARRLLDRHLAGVLTVESTLDPVTRLLYLAAHHSVGGRTADAAAMLEKSFKRGLFETYGVMGGLHQLADSRLLGEAARHPNVQLALESPASPSSSADVQR